MALIKADRVRESSTTTGTGAFTLSGAESTFRAFSAVCSMGDTCYYAIAHRTSNEWETGLGTYSSANTLTRTTVHASSNSGSAVNFSAGTKEVFLTLTAAQLSGILDTSGITGTLAVANGGTGAATGTAAAVNLVNSAPNDGQEYTLKSKKTSGTVSYYWVDSTGYAPALDLLFAANKSLTPYAGPTPSFSRASTGTYFNSSGVLTSASINTPRFDHTYNGTSWVSRGLLVEEQRTNLTQYSEDLTNAYWPLSGCTISANSGVAPDGSSNADRIVESTGTVNAGPYTNGISMTSGTTYTASAFVKSNGRSILILYFQSVSHPTPGRIAWFDLANGTTQVQSGVTATITNVGNSWYRITTTATANATNAASGFGLLTVDAMGSTNGYTGNGASGFFAWGLSCEAGSFATSYIPSLSNSSTTRSADVCQISGSDFSGFWNGTESSIVFDGDYTGIDSSGIRYTFGISNTSSPSTSFFGSAINRATSGNYSTVMYNADTLQFQLDTGTNPSAGSRIALALAIKANDFAISRDGGSPVTDASGSIPTMSAMAIGSIYSLGGYMNGHIARLRYYPVRLPNATLQTLST